MSLASYYEIRDQHKALTANNPQPVLMTSASSLLDPCLFFFLPNHPTGRGGALTSLKLSEKGWGRVKSLIAFQWKLSFQNTEPLQTFCQDHSSIKLKHRSAPWKYLVYFGFTVRSSTLQMVLTGEVVVLSCLHYQKSPQQNRPWDVPFYP